MELHPLGDSLQVNSQGGIPPVVNLGPFSLYPKAGCCLTHSASFQLSFLIPGFPKERMFVRSCIPGEEPT